MGYTTLCTYSFKQELTKKDLWEHYNKEYDSKGNLLYKIS